MRYLLGVIATVFILIAAIFWIRSGGGSEDERPVPAVTETTASSYADSAAKMVYEVHGELVAEENRQAVRVTIDRNQRILEVLDGYTQRVSRRETFPNTAAAFEEFVYGLSRAGFSNRQEPEFETEKGVCPNGNIRVYKIIENNLEVSRLWGASCGRDFGNFGGNRQIIEDLFEDQIPEYNRLTRDVEL